MFDDVVLMIIFLISFFAPRRSSLFSELLLSMIMPRASKGLMKTNKRATERWPSWVGNRWMEIEQKLIKIWCLRNSLLNLKPNEMSVMKFPLCTEHLTPSDIAKTSWTITSFWNWKAMDLFNCFLNIASLETFSGNFTSLLRLCKLPFGIKRLKIRSETGFVSSATVFMWL